MAYTPFEIESTTVMVDIEFDLFHGFLSGDIMGQEGPGNAGTRIPPWAIWRPPGVLEDSASHHIEFDLFHGFYRLISWVEGVPGAQIG